MTGIRDEGCLRLARPGHTAGLDTADRLLEGKQVVVQGHLAPLVGAVTAQSTHLRGARPPLFDLGRAYVEMGARSAAEAREMGAGELSPVAWRRLHTRLAGGRMSGPALGDRAGAAVILAALAATPPDRVRGQVTVAFVTQRWFGGYSRGAGRGSEALAARLRPTALCAVAAAPAATLGGGAAVPTAVFPATRERVPTEVRLQAAAVEDPGAATFAGASPTLTAVGVPVRYRHTAVEVVDPADLEAAAAMVREWLTAR